jgi:DNA polymerase III epsilon subunit-like protein
MKRYCPQCETVLDVQSQPEVVGRCPKCNWSGGPDDFLTEFKASMKDVDARWTPYVSIDLETTGLNPDYCQILEFGAVIDDWHSPVEELPRFQRYIRPHDEVDGQPYIYGQPYALALNAEIIRKLASNDPAMDAITCSEEELGMHFAGWLQQHNINPQKVTAAGKNFGSFDLQFLLNVHDFNQHVHFRHRAIDPAVLYWCPDIDDKLPDTKTCLERAGLDGRVAHTAIEDCISVIQLIRRGVRKCKLSASG